MVIAADAAWISSVALLAIRIAPLFVLAPVFGSVQVPLQFRVLFVLALAALLVNALSIKSFKSSLSLGNFATYALSEFALGLLFAFGLFAAFGAFMLAGRIIDLQMGFGVAGLIDPASQRQAPLLGTFLNVLAIVMFFAIDGHHMILRGLAFSLEHIPLGTTIENINAAAVIGQFGLMFIYAVAIVAPALFGILLLDLGMAVMARSMPQMNVFIVSIPLKIFVGLVLIAFSLAYLAPLATRIFESVFIYWESVLGLR